MRLGLLLLGFILLVSGYLCFQNFHSSTALATPASDTRTSGSPEKIDFATQIRPIFEAKCQPCHFSGGVMYERLPFDRAETIKKLGTKIFTRIKDEKEQRLIREFLEQ